MTGYLVTAEEANTCSFSAFHSRAYDRAFKRACAMGMELEVARKKARKACASAKVLYREVSP